MTLVGDGVPLEEHARVAGTIAYELACGIRTPPGRASREVASMCDLVARRRALQAERHAELEARLRRLLAPLAATSARSTSAAAPARSRTRSRRSSARSSASTPRRSTSRPRRQSAPAELHLRRWRRGGARRSRTATSTSSAACASCTTCGARSSSSRSSRGSPSPGGRILLVDQLGDVDPIRSLELDRFERARDPSHTRLLPDADIRGFLDANDLVVTTNEIVRERRDMSATSTSSGSRARSGERVARMAPARLRGRGRLVRRP